MISHINFVQLLPPLDNHLYVIIQGVEQPGQQVMLRDPFQSMMMFPFGGMSPFGSMFQNMVSEPRFWFSPETVCIHVHVH